MAPALRVHHMVPVSLGGNDELENLALVCANCHSLVHYFSSKRFADRDVSQFVALELDSQYIPKLRELIQTIHQARSSVEKNKGLVESAVTWEEAIAVVSSCNRFSKEKQKSLTAVVQKVVTQIPPQIFTRCSLRLLSKGKYISINLMNYLLFRSPAYSDMGGKPHYECYLIAPVTSKLARSAQVKERGVFRFKYFEAINFGLSYQEVLELSEEDWQAFRDACIMASNARRSREWVSNIISG